LEEVNCLRVVGFCGDEPLGFKKFQEQLMTVSIERIVLLDFIHRLVSQKN